MGALGIVGREDGRRMLRSQTVSAFRGWGALAASGAFGHGGVGWVGGGIRQGGSVGVLGIGDLGFGDRELACNG